VPAVPGEAGALARDYDETLSELVFRALEGLRSKLLAKHCEGLAIDNPEGRDIFIVGDSARVFMKRKYLGKKSLLCCSFDCHCMLFG
jgi:hypothetical protein